MATKVGNLMPCIERKLSFCRFPMGKLCTAGLAAAAFLIGSAASAQQSSVMPAANQIETHVHNYGDRNSTCLRWTDQCRTCNRDAGGNRLGGPLQIFGGHGWQLDLATPTVQVRLQAAG